MGKRSNFERREGDFYPTPRAAVLPLIPFLRGIRTFAEPCCGDGDLVRHLESLGLRCVYAGDIRTGQDALALDHYGAIDAIITNPPWSRRVLHRLIKHFQNIAPTWLLLDSDWAQTKQAAPFMPHCSDVLPVGRVQWIKDSEFSNGKDNAAWYRFDAWHSAGPVLHTWRGRGQDQAPRLSVICQQCGGLCAAAIDARFCSPACKQQAYRKRLSVTASVTQTPSP